jgi:hypothetical protein
MAETQDIALPSVTTEEPTAVLRWVGLPCNDRQRLQQAIKVTLIDKDGKTVSISHEWRDVPFVNSP